MFVSDRYEDLIRDLAECRSEEEREACAEKFLSKHEDDLTPDERLAIHAYLRDQLE